MVKPDPVDVRRAQVVRLVALGKRIGYGAMLGAVVGFVFGIALSFPAWTVLVATVGLVVSCIALPPAMVFGYAVRAAERDERQGLS